MSTVRVVSTHPESQGSYVVIREVDFDPAVHALYEEPATLEGPAPETESTAPAPVNPTSRRKR